MATYAFAELPLLETDGTLNFSYMPDEVDTFATTFGPFDYTDFQPNSGTTGTIDLGTLPAGFIITKVTVKHTTAFAGSGMTTATVYCGISGSLRRITIDFDVMQTVGDAVAQLVNGAISFASTASQLMKVTLQTSGLASGINSLTAGEFNVCIQMVKAPTAMGGGDHWTRFGKGSGGVESIYLKPDDFSNGTIVKYDSGLGKFIGIPITFAPDNAQYLTLIADSTLTQERVFTPRYHMSGLDGGGGAAYNLDMDFNMSAVHEEWEDFINTVDIGRFSPFITGTAAAVTSTGAAQTRVGICQLQTGSTDAGGAAVHTDFNCYRASGGEMIFEAMVRVVALTDLNEYFRCLVGFMDSNHIQTNAIVDGIYFEYDSAVGNDWQATTRSNSTQSQSGTSQIVNANQWYKLRLVVNAAGTSVDFFVDANGPTTITTNIPSGAGREFGICALIEKYDGTTSRNFDVDSIYARKVFTTAR